MESYGPVVVRQTIAAPQPEVWKMLTDAEARARWSNVSLEPEFGGVVSAEASERVGARSGEIDVYTEGLTLGWRWTADDAPVETTVVVMIRPDDDINETRITIIESGFAALDDAPQRVAAVTREWEGAFRELAVLFDPDAFAEEQEGADAVADDAVVAEPADVTEGAGVEDDSSVDNADAAVDDTDATDDAGATEEADDTDDVDEVDDTEPEAQADDPTTADADDIEEAPEDAIDAESTDEDDADAPFMASVATDDADDDGDDIVDAEVIDEEVYTDVDVVEAGNGAILLPEVGQVQTGADTTVTASAGLRLDQPIEVEEVSEWELLLRGEPLDED